MSTYSLQDISNYNDGFNYSTTEIFARYTTLILEYLVRSIEVIEVKNSEYFKYIICRGISTISHVFKILLLYTKNVDVASHHTQRAYYYYVEFIGQIGADSHTYLQLNSKDASLFVYKKTIFDINNEFRKDFASIVGNDMVMENINMLITLYSSSLIGCINTYNIIESKTFFIKSINKDISKLTQHILNLSLGKTEEDYHKKLDLICKFCNAIPQKNTKQNIKIIEYFAKKIKAKNVSFNSIQHKLLHSDNTTNYNKLSSLKYVNWLLTVDKQ